MVTYVTESGMDLTEQIDKRRTAKIMSTDLGFDILSVAYPNSRKSVGIDFHSDEILVTHQIERVINNGEDDGLFIITTFIDGERVLCVGHKESGYVGNVTGVQSIRKVVGGYLINEKLVTAKQIYDVAFK